MPIRRANPAVTAAMILAGIVAAVGRLGADDAPTPRFDNVTRAAGLVHTHAMAGVPRGEPELIHGGLAAGDADGDGWTDLVMVRGTAGPLLLYRNQGDGTFVDVADAAGVALDDWRIVAPAFADVDGDEDLDLLLGGIRGAEPRLLRNRGDGIFDEVDGAGGLLSSRDTWSFAVGDDDGDGDLDLFLA
ncbi:MAG: VCBS repeat-containing protein, partial [Acidobacteriota bacterium]